LILQSQLYVQAEAMRKILGLDSEKKKEEKKQKEREEKVQNSWSVNSSSISKYAAVKTDLSGSFFYRKNKPDWMNTGKTASALL
jgi:hypothetical protein